MPFSTAMPADSASLVLGWTPTPTSTRSAATVARGQDRARHPLVAGQVVQPHALADRHALGLVQRAEPVGGLGRRDRWRMRGAHLDQRHLKAPARADGRRPPARCSRPPPRARAGRHQLGRQPVRVGHVAHDQDAVEVPPDGGGQPARRGAGGQHQLVVGYRPPRHEQHLPRARVDGRDLRAEPQVDGVLPVEGRVAQGEPLAPDLAQEVPLGQGRALVGRVRLAPDQRHGPLEAVAPQPRRDSQPRLARAHDDHAHGCPPLDGRHATL
jgi:hypothetical protein